MGHEELIHVTALWLAFFYAAAITCLIGRHVFTIDGGIWLWIAFFSFCMGITMIAGASYEPRTGYCSTRPGRIDYGAKKASRLFVSLFILIFVGFPFGAIDRSPTPLADFLNLTLITYIWLLYVAILILSIFCQGEPEEAVKE